MGFSWSVFLAFEVCKKHKCFHQFPVSLSTYRGRIMCQNICVCVFSNRRRITVLTETKQLVHLNCVSYVLSGNPKMYTSVLQTVYNNKHANNLFRKVLLFKDFLKDLSDVHCWLAKFCIPPQEKKKKQQLVMFLNEQICRIFAKICQRNLNCCLPRC